jgi:hypothetical protein
VGVLKSVFKKLTRYKCQTAFFCQTVCDCVSGKMVFTVTLKGQLGLNIKAGPNGKSIEVTLVKPNASADEWLVEHCRRQILFDKNFRNTVAFVEGDDAVVINVGKRSSMNEIDNICL